MNYTPNYALNQWAASDRIQRADFNADNAKIDAAIAGRAQIKVGVYNPVVPAPNTPYHISVGFRPKAVLIWFNTVSRYAASLTHCGMVLDGHPIQIHETGAVMVEIEDDGFFVVNDPDYPYYPKLAVAGNNYLYLALA